MYSTHFCVEFIEAKSTNIQSTFYRDREEIFCIKLRISTSISYRNLLNQVTDNLQENLRNYETLKEQATFGNSNQYTNIL